MRLTGFLRAAVVPAAVLLAPSVGTAQITLGQIDTFQSGSLLGWSQGNLTSGPVLVDGGPGGAGDMYMQMTATGFGAGGRLTVFNRAQWTGNYIAAGVTSIEMDLRAPTTNTQDLLVRIAFKADPSQFSPGYVTTTPFLLDNDGLWHHAVFTLSAGTMTPVGSPGAFNTFMSTPGPGEMRILHSSGTVLNGDPINAVLGMDNIQAHPIPEPSSILAVTVAVGAAGALLRRWRRGFVPPAGGGQDSTGGEVIPQG